MSPGNTSRACNGYEQRLTAVAGRRTTPSRTSFPLRNQLASYRGDERSLRHATTIDRPRRSRREPPTGASRRSPLRRRGRCRLVDLERRGGYEHLAPAAAAASLARVPTRLCAPGQLETARRDHPDAVVAHKAERVDRRSELRRRLDEHPHSGRHRDAVGRKRRRVRTASAACRRVHSRQRGWFDSCTLGPIPSTRRRIHDG